MEELKKEKAELDARIDKLEEIVAQASKLGYSINDLRLILRQLSVMCAYSNILEERIIALTSTK